MPLNDYQKLFNVIKPFITDERLAVFENVLSKRTQYVTVVLEDITHSQNISAVMRSCDCFGIQSVHIIENEFEYGLNPDVSMGSHKWLSIHKHKGQQNNTLNTIQQLKGQGYRIIATSPHTNDTELEQFDLSRGKAALFFGTEQSGLSKTVFDHADEFLRIPMFGFTESFNISVSASLILYELTRKLHQSNLNWQLTPDEKFVLTMLWSVKTLKKPALVLKEFCKLNNLDFKTFNSRLYHLSI